MNNNNKYPYFGRMNDPTASAWTKGICGDEMEFYLNIKDGIIEEIKFFTENGCDNTMSAGNTVADIAKNRKVMDALNINPKVVITHLKDLPEDGRHCAILATITFYKAIADYLLKS